MASSTSVPPQMVNAQLSRIINSRQFCNAPRLTRFLTYVVQECLAGRTDRLKGYAIGLEVFDRPDDFDPQTDTIVRVQARALRQKLGQYYAQAGAEDPLRISIAKGAYEPTFDYIDAANAPPEQDASAPLVPTNKPSIAVLPFDDFSQLADNEFFLLGLTEEIIVDLSRFKDLSVFSRATAQQAKADGLSIRQMRDRFHPDFVLEGSLRADNQTLKVTTNLIETSEDRVILVDQFACPLDPTALYTMQDRIAEQIVSRISDRFGPIGRFAKRAGNSGQSMKWDTINWIYRYHRKGIELDQVERTEIRAGLEKAVALDPNSSNAHAVLAFLWLDDYQLDTGGLPDDILDRALACAQRAVDSDEESAQAYCAMARTQFHLGNLVAFRRAADQAVRLNPGNADMLAMLGMCFMVCGQAQHARPMLDKAVLLNPLHPGWYRLIRAYILMQTDGPEAALAEVRIDPLPDKYFYICHLIWMLVEGGDMEGAYREKAALLARFPDFERFIGRHYRAASVDPALKARVFGAWRQVGLEVRDHSAPDLKTGEDDE
ncbi:hypothetical protein OO012_04700 [Rhodobacteraceae bacterium KMM 6894]|nr:hypothetical protein [Rhodobacteraceae bacterium KMM 6894]